MYYRNALTVRSGIALKQQTEKQTWGSFMIIRDSLAKQVYTQLKDIIVLQETDGFRMGDRINENDIAEMFECSITPVRESLNMLRHDGLVVGKSYRSSNIVSFSRKEVDDLFELRSCLEQFAMEQSVKAFTEEDVAKLREANEKYRAAYLQFEETGIVEFNKEFHAQLLSKSHNEALRSELDRITERIAMIRSPIARKRKETGDQEYLLKPVREHAAIVEALEKKDIEGAKKALEAHIDRICADSRECYI